MPPTIGDRLKQAREQRDLTLADVAHETRIPIARLQDLEHSSYTSFGSLTYAKGFLRAYAEFLDVDASEVLDQFQKPPLGGEDDYKYLTRSYGPWIRQRRRGMNEAPVQSQVMAPSKSFTIVAMICGGVMVLGMGMLLGNAWLGHKPEPEATVAKAIPFDAAAQAAAEAAARKKSWAATDTPLPAPEQASSTAQVPETTTLRAEIYRPPEDAATVVPPKAIPVEDDAPSSKNRGRSGNAR